MTDREQLLALMPPPIISAAAERQVEGTTLHDRLGNCFELSARLVTSQDDAEGVELVHGSIQGDGHPRIAHAWIETGNRWAYDPVADVWLPTDAYQVLFGARPERFYAPAEVNRWCAVTGHWGAWEDLDWPYKELGSDDI